MVYQFLIKIACIYVLVGHKKFIQQWFGYTGIVKILWLTKFHNFLTVTWCLFLKTPILKVQFLILIKIIFKLYEYCTVFEIRTFNLAVVSSGKAEELLNQNKRSKSQLWVWGSL